MSALAAPMDAREILHRATGLELSEQSVARAVRQRMQALAQNDADTYLHTLAGAELRELIELVVVPESWMFRDPGAFASAARFVQARCALATRPQRILSIPCAGGEEPYSMAMALQDAGVARANYLIDAFDLSALAIERARAGLFTRNAFRGHALAFRERHFSRVGEQYQISEAIRQQVRFSQANLLAFDVSTRVGAYDLIFCRNLLIYFDEATTAAAVTKLHTLLADDGLLFAGYSEVPAFCLNRFTAVRDPAAFALRKEPADLRGGVKSATPKLAADSAARAGSTARAAPASSSSDAAPMRSSSGATLTHSSSGAAPMRSSGDAAMEHHGHIAPAASGKGSPTDKAGAAASEAIDLLARARTQADLGDYPQASASCHAVLALQPECADAYFILGMVSECQHRGAEAQDHWRRCIYLQPEHYEALCHLALLAEQGGDAAGAAGLKQRAARIYRRLNPDAAKGPR